MELHQRFKTDEQILSFCFKNINQTYVIAICNSYDWIGDFCKHHKISYAHANDKSIKTVKYIGANLSQTPSALYIYMGGVEFWVIKAYLENNHNFPKLIITSFNYISGINNPITVPYTQNQNLLNINYKGASFKALVILLSKYKYKYLGVLRYAQGIIFLQEDQRHLSRQVESNICEILSLPNVSFGIQNRWAKVKNNFWVNVK